MALETNRLNDDGIALYRLAEALRAEVIYMHETGNVQDSVRNANGLLYEAEGLLGPHVAED
jgi:hypothetical protein